MHGPLLHTLFIGFYDRIRPLQLKDRSNSWGSLSKISQILGRLS